MAFHVNCRISFFFAASQILKVADEVKSLCRTCPLGLDVSSRSSVSMATVLGKKRRNSGPLEIHLVLEGLSMAGAEWRDDTLTGRDKQAEGDQNIEDTAIRFFHCFFPPKGNLFVCQQGIHGLPLVEEKIPETGSSLGEKRVR